jgi:hypothetical protein
MPIIRDLKLNLGKRDVLRALGMRDGKPVRPQIESLVDEVLGGESRALIKPAVAYDIFDVAKIEENAFHLRGGAVFHGTVLPRVFTKALKVVVAVGTIGHDLEQKVSQYFREGNRLKGLVLDSLGSTAVETLRLVARERLKKEIDGGLEVSSSVSPGSPAFPITEQFELFKLVPAEKIDVKLTLSAMMVPRKSVSMVMGVGKDMPVWSASERCDHCSKGTTCAYRYQPNECEYSHDALPH